MIFRDIGEVVPGFYALGSSHTPVYLLEGERPVFFDSGMSYFGPRYVEHARRVLGDRPPRLLAHTHVHFDHCGAAATLRDAFPGLGIAASPEGAEILKRPRAIEVIQSLCEEARLVLGEGIEASEETRFRPFVVDTILREGDEIQAGSGLTVQVLATPGHTRDFLSYYVPERKILIASEAVGCAHFSGKVSVEFVSGYDAYLASLMRLSELEVDVLCQGHVMVYTGDDCREFLNRSLAETERYRAWVEELLTQTGGDIAATVERVKELQWVPLGYPKQPQPAYLLNTEARVRHLCARMGLQPRQEA